MTDAPDRPRAHQQHLTQLQRRLEGPLTIASLIFLVDYAWSVLANPSGASSFWGTIVLIAAWLAFLADYLLRLYLADRRWHWIWTHFFDLLVVLLPLLRPIRLLRAATLLSVFQRTAGTAIRARVIIYVAGASALLIFIASLAVLDSERDARGANIVTFGDSVWWAFVTIATVGYGDYFPVTPGGRIVAVALMLGGITLVGVTTATLSSWIVDRVADVTAHRLSGQKPPDPAD
jgi:voltage-gated potassium channel